MVHTPKSPEIPEFDQGKSCAPMIHREDMDDMGMDQYLLIPFFQGINIHFYKLFWCSPGVQGFDTLPYGVMLLFACPIFPQSMSNLFFHADHEENHQKTAIAKDWQTNPGELSSPDIKKNHPKQKCTTFWSPKITKVWTYHWGWTSFIWWKYHPEITRTTIVIYCI